MAKYRRQKEALRAATLAFFAGVHCITEEVEKSQALVARGPDSGENRHTMLQSDYARCTKSSESATLLADILDEEELYPFGSEWPRDAMAELMSKVIAPKLTLGKKGAGGFLKFRFRKGFRESLDTFASTLESSQRKAHSLDHWLALLLNTTFYAGATIAARLSENPKAYYSALQELEAESEAWGRYPQLVDSFERQLRRETRLRTGLVSDLDL